LKKSKWFGTPLKLELGYSSPDSNLLKSIYDFHILWMFEPDTIAVNTSGSTGTPKKIELTKTAMAQSARKTIDFFGLNHTDNFLLCLPVDFIAGKMMVVRAMLCNANLVAVEPVANPLVVFLDNPLKIHFAAFTPLQVSAILANEQTRNLFTQINKVIIGGGEIPPGLEKKLVSLPNKIYATYGMTETITHIAVRKTGNPVYKVFKDVQIGLDSRQCLAIQADYLGPEKIITNDMVELQGPHEFRFLGRYDNVINSGGIKLHPERIEKKLEGIFDRNFYIYHKPDEVLGQKVVLVIEGEPFDATTLGLLKNTLKDLLDKYEVPKDILFMSVFERTVSGKTIRKA